MYINITDIQARVLRQGTSRLNFWVGEKCERLVGSDMANEGKAAAAKLQITHMRMLQRLRATVGNAFGQVLSVLLALWLGRFVLELNLFGAEGTYYVSSRSVVATTVTQGGRATTNIQENAQIRTNLWNVASNEM
eukprot:s2804_g4.t4